LRWRSVHASKRESTPADELLLLVYTAKLEQRAKALGQDPIKVSHTVPVLVNLYFSEKHRASNILNE
jgi:hypothetical protein